MGCQFLLQGIFLTQGSNLGLPHCKQILYYLSHEGSRSFCPLTSIKLCSLGTSHPICSLLLFYSFLVSSLASPTKCLTSRDFQVSTLNYNFISPPCSPGIHIHCQVKVAQSCLTLCNPMDYTVPGILQARILEWVAFPFSRGSFQPRDRTQVSRIADGFFTS